VATVTGAAAGLGRAEALALASAGADLVLSDISPSVEDTADAARALGVKATIVVGDIGDAEVARAVTDGAVTGHGRLDIVVNNAGFTRDRMLFGMSDDEWDDVVRVHLRGHFLVSRNAAAYWRDAAKAGSGQVYGRLINTSSEAWLLGSPGQANYAAAKAGITALTLSAARGLDRYGVRANVICPRARTAMTAGVFGAAPDEAADPLSVEHVAPFVAYLASPAADAVQGQLFVVYGGKILVMGAPAVTGRFEAPEGVWTTAAIDTALHERFAEPDPESLFVASDLIAPA
jgi:NAD(P)-dependent dehydrogenase (short-subunit alcohol dehydrogenase family)